MEEGLELHAVLEVVAVLLTVVLIVRAYRSLPGRSATLLSLAMLGFLEYVIEFSHDDRIIIWLRHLPVYAGMVFLFAFINSFGKRPEAHRGSTVLLIAPVFSAISWAALVEWAKLMTDEGLQHILVLPLFAALFIASILRSAQSGGELVAKPLRWFIAAGVAIMTIHVLEFLIESQKLIPSLMGEAHENLELVLYFAAVAYFWLGLRKGPQLTRLAQRP